MALTHITLTAALGAAATNNAAAHPNTLISFKPAQCSALVDNSATLSTEGIIISLLQSLFTNQGTDLNRVMDLTKSTPIITTRGGDTVRGERYVITIYSGNPVGTLDPDTV